MYQKIVLPLALLMPTLLHCAEQETKRRVSVASQSRKGCDKFPLLRKEEAQRYKAIVESPHFYDLAKKILEKEQMYAEKIRKTRTYFGKARIELEVAEKMAHDIKETFLGMYKNHNRDWLTHRKQMHTMARHSVMYVQKKYASEQCCVIL